MNGNRIRIRWSVFVVCLSINFCLAQDSEQHEGLSFTGDTARCESVAAIMNRQYTVISLHTHNYARVRSFKRIAERELLEQHPESELVEKKLALVPHQAPSRSLVHKDHIGMNFFGAAYSESGFVPPNADGAAGIDQYLLVASGIVKTFHKSSGELDGVVHTSLDNFFASVLPSGTYVGDVRVLFDTTAQRFIVVGRSSGSAFERLVIAVSQSAVITPESDFYFYGIDTNRFTNGLELDYPTLGCDTHALYSGANLFDSQGRFVNSVALVIQKSSLLTGGPVRYTVFSNLINFRTKTGLVSPVGVINFDPNPTYGFFIGVNAFYHGALTYTIISNPSSAHPTISSPITIPVAATADPILVPHRGNTFGARGMIGPTDDRLNWSHIRNGLLYTSHNAIGVTNTGSSAGVISRNGIRWYQIQFSNPFAPQVLQSSTLCDLTAFNDADQRHYFIGAVMSSGQEHILLGSTVAGADAYLDAALSGRLANDPLGHLDDPVRYTQTDSSYNITFDLPQYGFHRWGDYSTISVDPVDNMTFWSVQEFCNAPNSWGLQIAQLHAPPPASIIKIVPATLARGTSCQTVEISGISLEGSGFYDPGAGFAGRLKVLLSHGLTATSVVYHTPTSLTITVDATHATAGMATITVINPDGQQSSAPLLQVY